MLNKAMRTTAVVLAMASLVAYSISSAVAANPGNPATLDTSASVKIIKPITIEEIQPLDFGTIVGPIGPDANNRYSSAGSVTGSGGGSVVVAGHMGSHHHTGEPFAGAHVTIAATGGCSDTKVVLNLNLAFDIVYAAAGAGTTTYHSTIDVTNASDGTGPLGVVTCPYRVTMQYN